jgi:two-component system, OmpR family, KDP operon response regulator KdpE
MTVPVRILVVDGEPRIHRLLRATLTREGWRLIEARTAAEALAIASAKNPDIVLIDIELPDTEGTDVIRQLREHWFTKPIIVISTRREEQDVVMALEDGADDYMIKPFSTGELMARVRVALRHEAAAGSSYARPILEAGDLKMDLDRRVVSVGGREVHLTPHEYDLLAYLMKHVGQVMTHPRLLEKIWGPAHKNERTYLRVYMSQLRQKLEADPSRPRHIVTEPGVGYRLKETREELSAEAAKETPVAARRVRGARRGRVAR